MGGGRQDLGRGAGVPAGVIRVLVMGDSGCGKTSLVHLITRGKPLAKPMRTVGCNVSVKFLEYAGGEMVASRSSSNFLAEKRGFFVELWDISGSEEYRDCRPLFYSQVNGVILVHDLSQKKSKSNLQKWASEVTNLASFVAPHQRMENGLPVPNLTVGNKVDLLPKDGNLGSSGNILEVARYWAEKRGLVQLYDELPRTEKVPLGAGLVVCATEGRLDHDVINGFFFELIKRRYYPPEEQLIAPMLHYPRVVPSPHGMSRSAGSEGTISPLSSHSPIVTSTSNLSPLGLPLYRDSVSDAFTEDSETLGQTSSNGLLLLTRTASCGPLSAGAATRQVPTLPFRSYSFSRLTP